MSNLQGKKLLLKLKKKLIESYGLWLIRFTPSISVFTDFPLLLECYKPCWRSRLWLCVNLSVASSCLIWKNALRSRSNEIERRRKFRTFESALKRVNESAWELESKQEWEVEPLSILIKSWADSVSLEALRVVESTRELKQTRKRVLTRLSSVSFCPGLQAQTYMATYGSFVGVADVVITKWCKTKDWKDNKR